MTNPPSPATLSPDTAPPSLRAFLAEVVTWVDAELDRRLTVDTSRPGADPGRLGEAMRYAATGPGKRLRPAVVAAACAAIDPSGRSKGKALIAGAAIEMLHAYTLVHDDLPAMDDDDLRHGKPTAHKAFGEATAILAGDCLHALAFEVLADPDTHPDPFVRADLTFALARASGPNGMAGGQALDLAASTAGFDLAGVTRLQAMKTGALIAAAVEMGAILGRIPPEGRSGLRGYARDIGLAFQIADDLLDVEGDEAAAGKALRKDAEAGKETFVSLLGVEPARERCRMLVDQAIEHLHAYGEEADLLRAIARFIVERDR